MPLHKAHQIDMPKMLPEQGRCQGCRQSVRCILAPAEIEGHPQAGVLRRVVPLLRQPQRDRWRPSSYLPKGGSLSTRCGRRAWRSACIWFLGLRTQSNSRELAIFSYYRSSVVSRCCNNAAS